MKGPEAYHAYYRGHFGARWERLRALLEGDAFHVARLNGFFLAENPQFLKTTAAAELEAWGIGEPDTRLANCFHVSTAFNTNKFPAPLLPFYKMDPASIVAARALNVQDGDAVLDMCAAPGGKTLVLAEGLGRSGTLVANEISANRRFRMMGVLKSYLTENVRARVDVRGFDGVLYGLKKPNTFDRILLDAPCSGDRGLLHKPADLETWSEKRAKNLAVRQYSLLASALSALKPGGTLVYSTCALSPFENDGVVEKLFKKKKGEFEIVKAPSDWGEETEHGRLILPDTSQAGPIFFCVVKKSE
jgi:16S rRNA C967 or C1407 C5-methylase (RsmB/RsmF family)